MLLINYNIFEKFLKKLGWVYGIGGEWRVRIKIKNEGKSRQGGIFGGERGI